MPRSLKHGICGPTAVEGSRLMVGMFPYISPISPISYRGTSIGPLVLETRDWNRHTVSTASIFRTEYRNPCLTLLPQISVDTCERYQLERILFAIESRKELS